MRQLFRAFLFIFTFSFVALYTHKSVAAGFSNGNDIQVNRIRGSLTLYCHDPYYGQQSKFVTCAADLWTPGLTDFFVGPTANASKVTLIAKNPSGSDRKRDANYDGTAGKSKTRFNLGISTLTQRPLLREGTNSVHFVLSEGNQMVSEGDFTATVTRGEEYRCQHDIEWGTPYDCDFVQQACDRYFEKQNYCQ